MRAHLVSATLALALAPACGETAPSVPSGRLQIATAPLHLASIVDADYGIAVFNGAGQLVWRNPSVRSTQYGDGRGSIAYVGPCDASAGVSRNRVELTVNAVYDSVNPAEPLAAGAWSNPTANGPIVREVDCVENQDARVAFDLTIMRAADQGFFDIGVQFSDVFCSAKVDCKDALLHDASGQRAPTVVMTFACTSGQGAPTWLHYSDVALDCGGTTTWLDPSVGPGQVGAHPPTLFQVATYRGQEGFADLDKCYWNLALGVNLGADARNCSLRAYATASEAAFSATGETPSDSVYPFIAFELPLTDAAGAFTCAQHPLNGTPGGVSTGYTSPRGTRFTHQWQCADDAEITSNKIVCDGLSVGTTAPATFTQSPGGVTFSVDGLASPLIKLPGSRRVAGCCANPCPGCSRPE